MGEGIDGHDLPAAVDAGVVNHRVEGTKLADLVGYGPWTMTWCRSASNVCSCPAQPVGGASNEDAFHLPSLPQDASQRPSIGFPGLAEE